MTDPGFSSPWDADKLRRLREITLRRLAKSDDPVLAELAREVRSGRMTMRDAAGSLAYRDVFAAAADKAVQAYRQMSPEEIRRTSTAEAVDEFLARHENEEEPPADDAEVSPVREEPSDDDFTEPIMGAMNPTRREWDGSPPQRDRWQRRR